MLCEGLVRGGVVKESSLSLQEAHHTLEFTMNGSAISIHEPLSLIPDDHICKTKATYLYRLTRRVPSVATAVFQHESVQGSSWLRVSLDSAHSIGIHRNVVVLHLPHSSRSMGHQSSSRIGLPLTYDLFSLNRP